MRRLALLFVLSVVGCDGDPSLDAGSGDASPIDAASQDGAAGDAGPRDASAPDGGSDAGPSDSGVDAGAGESCVSFTAREAGELVSTALDELSGLAASRDTADVLYANNDSGDIPRVFLLGTDGADLGTISLQGASHRDYEDIAVGPGPGGVSHVYVGDVGDNSARTGSGSPRSEIVVYRFAEPTLDLGAAPLSLDVTPEALTFTYPGSPQDCESIAVAGNGDLYFLSKVNSGPSTLYVARAPLASGELVRLTDVSFASGSPLATAMDIAPNDRALLVRTYNRVHLYPRPAGTWEDAIAGPPMAVTARPEIQGEAVAWRPDGRGYFTASEGDQPPLYAFEGEAGCVGW